MRKKYNTPHRSHVVKTRLSDEEYADFTERLAAYEISQSEFIRQAIRGTTIRPVITVSPVNDELLAAVGKLTAEYGKVGGNLNQISRYTDRSGRKELLLPRMSKKRRLEWSFFLNHRKPEISAICYGAALEQARAILPGVLQTPSWSVKSPCA